MLELLFGDLVPYLIGGAFAFLAAVLGYRQVKRRGAEEALQEAKDADYENAESIRDRVRDDRAQRVRELEGRGYRD